MKMLFAVASGVVIGFIIALSIGDARGHDPLPGWLMRYSNGTGMPCCSAYKDCWPVPERDLHQLPSGLWQYLPMNEVIPKASTFKSQDQQHWRCGGQNSPTRCLFIAPGAV